jgi:transposase InsO family protein
LWTTQRKARTDMFGWIAWYNHRRRHSALNNQAPITYQAQSAPVNGHRY